MAQLPTDAVVVLTGGNEGIGRAMAATLLADGRRVAVLDVADDGLADLREAYPDRLRYHECDVTVDDDVTAAVGAVIDEWDRIDVLVNNAAVFSFGPFAELTLDDARREFDTNVFGYMRTIRAVLPRMRAQGGGRIHNVSSGAGIVGHPGLSGYAATKGAIEAFTRSIRQELAPEGIAVTLMHPSLANTRSAAAVGYPAAATNDPADVGRGLARRIGSTDRTIYADWGARIGIPLVRLVPAIARWGSKRFVPSPEE
ncbi:SDR family NAD(P)-dependent oxidoreductase [Halobaculum lipolyticum]|uniref:SDR family NAD(P)-dependent oxidoreductase n=1 Tax=Halobaculum lipolyticum TaxID=3032001 RepID=A0ABD5WJ51_9EURY|nr:SDR family NAD(P)-dependent oxidoreductase [Halobaculum sp. DT31]